ncbi:MAG TPA: DUF1800 domain-containing protein [Gemmatimonadales bacterium]|nr:DUF1800 domain-containing protein [Gemmatimonadales bacterium]
MTARRHVATTARLATVLLAVLAPWRLDAQSLSPRDSALHALNRLAFGPRPGEVDRVAGLGVMRWIDQQLEPERVPDDRLAERERAFKLLDLGREELALRYGDALRERREMQRNMAASGDTARRPGAGPMREFRQLGGELQQLAVVRAALSERQLREVMVDFWTNHFNVFVGKGADRFLTPSYIEQTIRPHALGRFEDLLIATAQSPAMLFYLDNAQSIAPGSVPPMRGRRPDRMPQGINENYARELLELHTLGVDGGYTQQDVIAVARILTGWGIERPQQGAGFTFRDWAHDRGEKTVLGVRFPGGHGMDEGVRLLKLLANQHATMHHVSRKLCARLVADEPPDGCVDAAVDAWHRTNGDIRAVLRAIVAAPDFWAPQVLHAKVKTPFEFVVSAVRATGAEPDDTPRLAQVVARLGQPLYLQPAPTGYPETQAQWVNSGALLGRMNVAVALAAGRLPGVTTNLDAVVPLTADRSQLTDLVNGRVLSGTMTAHTRDVIRRQLADVNDPMQARALAVGLAIGGPEFQRQ